MTISVIHNGTTTVIDPSKETKIEIPLIDHDYSSFYPSYYPRIIPKSTFRSLGTSAIKSITPTYPSNVEIYSPINSVLSKDISFVYPLTPTGPIVNSVYDTVDDDIDYKRKITKYYYEKLFNDWIYDDLKKVLKFFNIKGSKISLVKNKKEYNRNSHSFESKKNIINFIINNIYDKYDLKTTLKRFTKITNTRWLDLKQNKKYVIKYIYNDIKKKIKNYYKKN